MFVSSCLLPTYILFLTVVQDTAEGMLRGRFKVWIGSTVLAAAFLGLHAAVLALPHQVVPVPATTDALSLVLYVKSSEICANQNVWKTLQYVQQYRPYPRCGNLWTPKQYTGYITMTKVTCCTKGDACSVCILLI